MFFCLELVALISLLQCKHKFCIQLEIFNQAKLCSCQEPALRVGAASLRVRIAQDVGKVLNFFPYI